MPSKVLFVLTSADKRLDGSQTGWYLPEAAHPYYVITGAGHTVDFASPAGPNPPVDYSSVETFKDEESVKFLKDPIATDKLAHAKKLADISAENYDAVLYVGGHGPVIDLPTDKTNIQLAAAFYNSGKITAAVCHGPAALVNVKDKSGLSIFAGKAFTGFSNVEEEQTGGIKKIPFLLEDKIGEEGGKYEKAAEPWGSHVVVSGNLLTGQNPASAKALGEEILKHLK